MVIMTSKFAIDTKTYSVSIAKKPSHLKIRGTHSELHQHQDLQSSWNWWHHSKLAQGSTQVVLDLLQRLESAEHATVKCAHMHMKKKKRK
jgi:hypothetical protein